MTIVDIHGICPACSEHKLHVNSGAGIVHCLNPDCPRPGAAHQILNDPIREHMVVFQEGVWSMIHPLGERLDGRLLHCQAGQHLKEFIEGGALIKVDARYWLREQEDRVQLVEVDDDDPTL